MPKITVGLLLALVLLLPLHIYGSTIQLPQTGQTTSYAAGDDGALQRGVAWPNPRFTDNGDQTITDNLTGLMWEKSAYSGSWDINPIGGISGSFTYQNALLTTYYYNGINHLGYSDWRLPNRNELGSLINLGAPKQFEWLMSQGFTNVLYRRYWTSSGKVAVDMAEGSLSTYWRTLFDYNNTYAWYVRGQAHEGTLPKTGVTRCSTVPNWQPCPSGSTEDGALQNGTAWPTPRFVDNSSTNPADRSITDNLTDLIWTKDAALSGFVTWQQALDFIQTLNSSNYLGFSDWRLPNLNELKSLFGVDLRKEGFINYDKKFWSSSTSANDTSKAWATSSIGTWAYSKTSTGTAWPVRAGQSLVPKTPVITWANPADIAYTTALSATQLNATADVDGTFAYTPAIDTVLNAGTHTLNVTFTPSDTQNYTTATKTVTITVTKVTPTITWADPADITYGTALSAMQLNATADVAGTFVYTPATGTVLNAGIHTMTVTFTPTDTVNYNGQTATVNLTVNKADQIIFFPAMVTKTVGDPSFDPGATASSGLLVTYASSDSSVATVSGGLINIIGGGTATITAYQAGDANYNPATPVQQALKVTGPPSKKPALTFYPPTPADGTITDNASINITGNVSGLKRKDTLTLSITNNGTTTVFAVAFTSPSGDFSEAISLGEGENVIEIIATNRYGTTIDRRTITLQSP